MILRGKYVKIFYMNEILTSADIRNKNKLKVLRKLISQNSVTIAQIASDCDSTPVTIAKIIQDFQEKSLVVAAKNEITNVGRHGSKYAINPDLGVFICFDLTLKDKLAAIIYDIKSKPKDFLSKEIGWNAAQAFYSLNEEIVKKGYRVLGVGVSVDGVYDSANDKVVSTLYTWYKAVSFAQYLKKTYGTENVFIGQGVAFAALAEAARLITDGHQSLYFVYVGDGLGGAFIKGHTTHEGIDGYAGEIGHILLGDRLIRLEDIGLTRINEKSVATAEQMRSLCVVIYNIIWLLNPDFFVISSVDQNLAEEVMKQSQNFIHKNLPRKIPLTTKFVLSKTQDATLAGIMHKLVSKYLLSL